MDEVIVAQLIARSFEKKHKVLHMYEYCDTFIMEVADMPRTSVLNVRIEPEIKAEAEKLFSSFGLTITDAVNVFLRQSLMRGGFPFEIVRYKPNEITLLAIAEAEKLRNDTSAKTFTSMEALREDLMSNEDDEE